MTLQSSGAISLANVQTEFGGSNPISISEYYGDAYGVPSSGTISLSNFYGTSLPISISNTANSSQGGSLANPYTFSGMSFGATATGRRILVTITGEDASVGGTQSISSVTIGGITATQLVAIADTGFSNGANAAIYMASVPSGTSGTVVVTFTGNMWTCAISVYRILYASGTANNTDSGVGSTVYSDVSTQAANAATVACCIFTGSNLSGSNISWSNITERYESQPGNVARRQGSAMSTTGAASSPTISATCSGADRATGVIVALKPD